jgi:hypothetical protein
MGFIYFIQIMKVAGIRSLNEPGKSFIYYKEKNTFTTWHHHPEYELSLITKGRGKRMIGDNIDRFKENDVVFIGPYTPHEFLCEKNTEKRNGTQGERIVIKFLLDFLGDLFLKLPENTSLNKFLRESTRGYTFFGKSKKEIISIILKMQGKNDIERLYSLFAIFKVFCTTNEYHILSSPAFNEPFLSDEVVVMQCFKIYTSEFPEKNKYKGFA